MDQIIFKQLKFVRSVTVRAVEGLSEGILDSIPEGFNNNIRWNLGHIYLVQEKFAFHSARSLCNCRQALNAYLRKGLNQPSGMRNRQRLKFYLRCLRSNPNGSRKLFTIA